MKFTIILVLIATTVCLDPKYNAFVTNIDVSKEPIREQWESKGVEGFAECNFAGASSFWRESDKPYSFNVWAGKVSSTNGALTGNIKSFRVPKGYKVAYMGQFQRARYTDPKQLAEVAGLCSGAAGCNGKNKPEIYADESCAVDQAYWYMNLNVYVNEYVKITRLIPDFLATVITTQSFRLQKAIFETQLKTCLDQKNSLTTTNTQLMNTKSSLEKNVSDLQTQLDINKKKIDDYTKIIQGSLDASQWIEAAKKYIEQNKKLQDEIDLLNARIEKVNCQIRLWTDAYNALVKQISDLKTLIAGQDAEITRMANDLQAQTQVIAAKEGDYNKIYPTYAKQVQDNKKLKAVIEEIKQQIKTLNDQLNTLMAQLATGESNEKTQAAQVNDILVKMNELTAKFNALSAQRIALKDQRAKNQVSLDALNTQSNAAQTEVSNYNSDIKTTTEKINANKSKIEQNTTSGRVETKTFYQGQVTTLSTTNTNLQVQIDAIRNDIAKAAASITKNIAALNDANGCIDTNTRGLNDVKPKYDSSYATVQKQADAMTSLIPQPDASLKKVRYSFDDRMEIKSFTTTAKTNLFEYIESLPWNPEPMFVLMRRRMKKLRRMRRRMF